MTLHLSLLLAAGLSDLAYSDPGSALVVDYQHRGTIEASHIIFGDMLGTFRTKAGRSCTFEIVVDQDSGCVISAWGCGLTMQGQTCR